MEDIRIGRRSPGMMTTSAVANGTWSRIIPANPRRTAMTISTDGLFPIHVRPEGQITGAAGILLSTSHAFKDFDLHNSGLLLVGAWEAEGFGGGANVTVLETELYDT